ncbi:MAG: HNH endonuclease signature motif containing protein [Candidatus Competibacteraceae bacterium]|jgi:5-methylcytosine-specific restriction endonuclease McrA|nr:HNH endonuclease signature motif containing protein [Candidatus Competibacteraceae bacterium]
MEIDTKKILEDFVDYLMPELSPHESSMYIFLLRNSYLSSHEVASSKLRIGQRTIAQKYGRGPKMAVPSRQHVIRQLENLEKKGCIHIGDTNREGTLYEIVLPSDIPLVIEKLTITQESKEEDYYNDPEKRELIYERDNFICQYCGEKVTPDNSTIDHFFPLCKGGNNSKENLRTACLMCNSIKSGKTYEESAVNLLKSIQAKRRRGAKSSV